MVKPNWNDDKKGRATSSRDRVLFVLVVLSLVFTCISRLFQASEVGRPAQSTLVIVIEFALAVGLVGLGVRILKAIPRGAAGRGTWIFLFGAGLVSLLTLFALQLTGGPEVKSPRSRSLESMKALGADLETMSARMNELKAISDKCLADMDNTRWERTADTSPNQVRHLEREDLREYLSKNRAVLDSIDRVLQYATESDFEGKTARLFREAESQGLTGNRKRPDLRIWRAQRRMYAANYNLHKIVDEHWEEWRSLESFPSEADLKPWQKEMKRLNNEMNLAVSEVKQLSGPASPAASQR